MSEKNANSSTETLHPAPPDPPVTTPEPQYALPESYLDPDDLPPLLKLDNIGTKEQKGEEILLVNLKCVMEEVVRIKSVVKHVLVLQKQLSQNSLIPDAVSSSADMTKFWQRKVQLPDGYWVLGDTRQQRDEYTNNDKINNEHRRKQAIDHNLKCIMLELSTLGELVQRLADRVIQTLTRARHRESTV